VRKIGTIVLNRRHNTDDGIYVRLKANAVHIMDLFANCILSWEKTGGKFLTNNDHFFFIRAVLLVEQPAP
jgi:hypothetical protein